jgi:hypothetical protein
MVRTLSAFPFGALAVAGILLSAPAQAGGAAGRTQPVASPLILAALPNARVQGAEPSFSPEQRPAKRERRCTFGIFPAASSRCIA